MYASLVTAGLMVLLSYIGDNIAAFVFHRVPFLMFVYVGPVVEETVRYYVASRFCWTAGPRKAALVGLLIGLGEVGTKTFEAILFAPGRSQPLLALSLHSASIPIHVALSLAFYAIWNRRWSKMVGLHVLMNATGTFLAMALWGKVTPLHYVLVGVGVITTLSAVIAGAALWQMRRRRTQVVAPPSSSTV